MKKLFSLLGIAFALNLGTLALKPTYQCAKAEEPTSVEISQEQPNSIETTSIEDDDSEYVINVDEEIGKISQTAKDTIEIIKTILNQKIVVAGVSISLGTFLGWLLINGISKILRQSKSKVEKKLEETQNKLGATEEQLQKEREEREKLDKAFRMLIENNKNETLKENCLALLNEKKEEVVEQAKEQISEVIDKGVEQVNEQTNKIKDLLRK